MKSYDEIYKDLENKISKKRFTHIKGVIEAAISLAETYRVDKEKAKLAALLHDCAKEYSIRDMISLIQQKGSSLYKEQDFLSFFPLLHGPAGAIVSQYSYGVTDEEVLEAIRVHTIGKINMSPLDKIIFVADYIEVNRDFPQVKRLRKLAFQDLDQAVLLGFDITISYLIENKAPIYKGTINNRNYILTYCKR